MKTKYPVIRWRTNLRRYFTEEKIKMSKIHMKYAHYLWSLKKGNWNIRKYCYTPIRIAKPLKINDNTQCCRECGANEILIYYWLKCITVKTFLENSLADSYTV